MRIEIIKTKHGFRIPQLESRDIPDRLYATLEWPVELGPAPTQNRQASTRSAIEKTAAGIGGDDLLEGILKRLPQDYRYMPSGVSDDDLLYEVLKEKYEL